MLAYFKEQENNPKIFSQDIIYTKEYDLYGKQAIKPEIMLEQGKTYNVKDLIGRMVVYSDNSAQQMLMKNAQSFWRTPYKDLGIDMPEDTQAENFMSVVDYARFFRILYNASYLNKQNSNITLGILTQTTFKDGLVAGIPPNILVAHKFGERSLGDIKQLHDCGIVYYPSRPYLLCIMTRGTDFNNLKKVIAKISKEVYSQVDIQTNK